MSIGGVRENGVSEGFNSNTLCSCMTISNNNLKSIIQWENTFCKCKLNLCISLSTEYQTVFNDNVCPLVRYGQSLPLKWSKIVCDSFLPGISNGVSLF